MSALAASSNGALHRRHRVKGAINSKRLKRRITSIVCSSAFWERGTISVLNDRVHEQTPITRQERSIFAGHNLEQLPVISVLAVGDIKSEKTKIARQSSQMSISNKA